MNQLIEWASMGGYSLYVWSSYGLVSVVLLANAWVVRNKKKKTQRQLQQWFK